MLMLESNISRRGLLGVGALAGTSIGLAGCAGPTPPSTPSAASGSTKSGTGETASSGSNPFGMAETGEGTVLIAAMAFGADWMTDCIKEFNKAHPGVKIKVEESKDMTLTHQARFQQGNPPEWIFPVNLNSVELAKQGQLEDLGKLYEAPAWDGEGTVADVMVPGFKDTATFDGKTLHAMPMGLNIFGLWYSRKVFKDHGWTLPKTFEEFSALAPEMLKTGIAPMVYDGVHITYQTWPTWALIGKAGGQEVLTAIDQLEPSAWKHEAVKSAAQQIEEIRSKGWFLEGSEGLDHTQSQTLWAQGKAAFIPCGGWLENESADVIPDDYEMAMTPMFDMPGNKLPHEAILVQGGQQTIVASKSPNPKFGLEFTRFMASKEVARIFTSKTKSLPATKAEWIDGLEMAPGLQSQVECLKAAGKNQLSLMMDVWYPKALNVPIENAVVDLWKGVIKSDEFVSRCAKAADDFAKSPEAQPKQRLG